MPRGYGNRQKSTIQVKNSTIIIGTVLCIKVKCKEKYLLINKYSYIQCRENCKYRPNFSKNNIIYRHDNMYK